MGWERKRGLLTEFNQFLLDPKTNDFRSNTLLENLNRLPHIRYIITLDADTNLVLNSGLELIGAMEHILNQPIIENGVVTRRAWINTATCRSRFAKQFSK